ncbi:MAG: glycosyltransferase family 4 protein [Chitinophagaceae bacterium]|nr:MAG: glycosyltransferase family 4 protein [Chitinophagaceae bacterium]
MKIAMLAPVAWRTPPRSYGPWEQVTSNLTEALVNLGIDVTLFATADSVTRAALIAPVKKGYAEDTAADAKVNECLHISEVMERAGDFDLIHNHFDFLPLTYSALVRTPMLTTIHGFSSDKIVPVYKKYNGHVHYASISHSDRRPELDYIGTVYNGLLTTQFSFVPQQGTYLLFLGRIHPHKGTLEAILVAKKTGIPLVIAGLIQDQEYYSQKIAPLIDGQQVRYAGNCGATERDQLLGGALALLHLISFEEPFGLSVAESLCCGTPVVAFSRGSMPELIRDGVTGYLVKDVDGAASAIEHISELDRRECSRDARDRFSSERMGLDYLDLYKKILSYPLLSKPSATPPGQP